MVDQKKYDNLLSRCQLQDEQTQYWRHEAECWRLKAEKLEKDVSEAQNVIVLQQAECLSQLSRLKKSTDQVGELKIKVQEYAEQVDEHVVFYKHNLLNLKEVCVQLNEERLFSREAISKLEMQKKHNLTLLKQISAQKKEDEAFRKSLPRLTKWGIVIESIYLKNVNLRFSIDNVDHDVEDVWCLLTNDKKVHFKTVMLRFILAGMSMLRDD